MKSSIPVYEYRPAGLLRGRYELIVLALRCSPDVGTSGWAADVDGAGSRDLEHFRKPCRGDVGHDDDWIGASRDREDTFDDLRRKMPGLVSTLHIPKRWWKIFHES